MEEFGCTPDSLQWYPQRTGSNAGKAYIANWLLDLITDRAGNQVHVTYQQDTSLEMMPGTSPSATALAGGGYEIAYQADRHPRTSSGSCHPISPGILSRQGKVVAPGTLIRIARVTKLESCQVTRAQPTRVIRVLT
jgi:hypothetical protein